MKLKIIICLLFMVIIYRETECKDPIEVNYAPDSVDYISALKDSLLLLSENSDNELFKIHCNSIISVIDSKTSFTKQDSSSLRDIYNAYTNTTDSSSPKNLSSYLSRQRSFIISWVSPTDNAVSLSWLRAPKNWDPEKKYSLYIQLHGNWDVASNSIQFMSFPLISEAEKDSTYNDGFSIQPWGRGNLFYEGISETDIWEAMAATEKIVKINPARKYICGQSMGGYGAFSIASKSPKTWAALGVYAGNLGYNNSNLLTHTTAKILKDLPTYIVVGKYDSFLSEDNYLYQLLGEAGNTQIKYVQFNGGHVYLQENVDSMYLWMRNFVNEDWNTTDIENTVKISKQFIIYPNPVKTSANITYSISENSSVSLSVYDIYGRLVNDLVNELKSPGEYDVTLDASKLTNGIYFIRLKTGDHISDSKIVVVK